MKKIYWDFLCVCFFLHILAKNSKKISYQTAVNVSKKKDWKLYTCNYMCDSNKTLLTYVYIYSKNNIYTQRVYFHAPHPFFCIFHKIPFHSKTSEFDVHLFSTPYINALFVSRSYQKAMHK